MPRKNDGPTLTINQNVLVFGLAIWAVWTNLKDGITAWNTRDTRLAATEQEVAALKGQVKTLETKLQALDTAVHDANQALESVRGDTKSERERAWGAEAALEQTNKRLDSDLTQLKAELKTYISQPKPNAQVNPGQ